jgi:beta-1,4-mannooligosaccharide/beta-1,4-mannosyl-N-acetylglucosamine phosphorylase
MSEEIKIYGESLPNIPWEEKPANCDNVVWRSKKNPIIPRDATPNSNMLLFHTKRVLLVSLELMIRQEI